MPRVCKGTLHKKRVVGLFCLLLDSPHHAVGTILISPCFNLNYVLTEMPFEEKLEYTSMLY